MYEIIKQINETTCLALNQNKVFVLKKFGVEDTEIYRKLMSINHKNVVRIYELTVINNEFYAVCEYVHGKTLNEIISTDGPLNENFARSVISDICDGLEAVHSVNLVHRDISPGNIMIADNGSAKIIDFGISRIRKNHAGADTQILGTHGFAAPEQYGFSQTGRKADIYSLGVLINYMVTGCLPKYKIANGIFSEIVIKCTQMDENRRFDSVQEIKFAIDKKYGFYKIIRKIPGFRNDILWHKITALFYYLLCLMFLAFSFLPTKSGIRGNIGNIIFVLFGMFAPVFIVFDFNNWEEKFPLTKNKRNSEKAAFRIIFAAIVSFAATLIFGLL